MQRFALPLAAFALAGLAGCTTYYDPPPAQPVTTTGGAPVVSSSSSAPVVAAAPAATAQTGAYRPGYGIVESISLVTLPASATAGGTLPPVV